MDGKLNMLLRIVAKRRYEIMKIVFIIYGGFENNLILVFDGMFDILLKRCKVDEMKDYVLS